MDDDGRRTLIVGAKEAEQQEWAVALQAALAHGFGAWQSWVRTNVHNFMLKEMFEQPAALRRCLSGRVVVEDGRAKLSGLELTSRQLNEFERIGLIGCGTAHYACRVGAMAIEQLAREFGDALGLGSAAVDERAATAEDRRVCVCVCVCVCVS